MCLWDNLGNSTDLHWEASIGQVGNIWETMFLVSLKNIGKPQLARYEIFDCSLIWPGMKYFIVPLVSLKNIALTALRTLSGKAAHESTRLMAALTEVTKGEILYELKTLSLGYAFFETSTMPETIATNSVSAMMESPLLSSTGSQVINMKMKIIAVQF